VAAACDCVSPENPNSNATWGAIQHILYNYTCIKQRILLLICLGLGLILCQTCIW
jgi:hypothetical protein